MTGKMQQDIFNDISRGHWECLSNIYNNSGFEGIKPEAKLLGVHSNHLINKIKQFNVELAQYKKITTELDILKDLSFPERLQLALNYTNNYLEFNNNNSILAE